MRQRNTTDEPLTLGGHGPTVAPGEVIDWPHQVAGLTPDDAPTDAAPARRGKTAAAPAATAPEEATR